MRVDSRPFDSKFWHIRFVLLNALALLIVSIFFRFWKLGAVPGLNGDEAWYGIQAQKLLAGKLESWYTPTGNLMNPFFFLPMVVLHWVFQPSIVLLRSVPLVTGIATLGVNFFLCRRTCGPRVACMSTLIFAVLPVCIAYSRFAWDPSQSVIATLLPIYVCLMALESRHYWRYISCAGVLQLFACWVHPTNVFFSPIIMITIVECITRQADQENIDQTLLWLRRCFLLLICVASIAFLFSNGGASCLLPFSVALIRLFTGSTVYQFISGAGIPSAPINDLYATSWFDVAGIIFSMTMLVASVAGYMSKNHRHARGTVLGLGIIFATAMFFRVGGVAAVSAGTERYALWIVAPTVLFVTLGIEPLTFRFRWAIYILLIAGWLLLASFYCNYFLHFSQTGGTAHPTFRTSDIDPKLAAFNFIKANSESDAHVLILTDHWWQYEPIEYLTYGNPQIQVEPIAMALQSGNIEPSEIHSIWLVTWLNVESKWGLPASLDALSNLTDSFDNPVQTVICDSAGRPLIKVVGGLPEQFVPGDSRSR